MRSDYKAARAEKVILKSNVKDYLLNHFNRNENTNDNKKDEKEKI